MPRDESSYRRSGEDYSATSTLTEAEMLADLAEKKEKLEWLMVEKAEKTERVDALHPIINRLLAEIARMEAILGL